MKYGKYIWDYIRHGAIWEDWSTVEIQNDLTKVAQVVLAKQVWSPPFRGRIPFYERTHFAKLSRLNVHY